MEKAGSHSRKKGEKKWTQMGAWTWCGKNFGELRERDFGFGG